MDRNKLDRVPDLASFERRVLLGRDAFVNYNIVRMREILRYLPRGRQEVFHTVPLLLHVNTPDLPGYVEAPDTPHGIREFSKTGFWRAAKRDRRLGTAALQALVPRRHSLRGLYLVGSAGTLGQTDLSDLNYWVLVDREAVGPQEEALLRRKIDRIRAWSEERFDQRLTFRVLDEAQARQNAFAAGGEGCGRLPEQALLKEEFYRSFVHLAGQTPVWAILPPGLTDDGYADWLQQIRRTPPGGIDPEDFVDLGSLCRIDAEEFPGALLRQLCLAPADPVKAMLRASVIVHHHFHQEGDGLLCNAVKRTFPERRLDSPLPDPWALALDCAVSFYGRMDDPEGLDLARLAAVLRMTGFPAPVALDAQDPRRAFLERCVGDWGWSGSQLDRALSFEGWDEEEKLELEDSILRKLWFLFELVLRSSEQPRLPAGLRADEVKALRGATESRGRAEPGRVPVVSTYLRVLHRTSPPLISCQDLGRGRTSWSVRQAALRETGDEGRRLFEGPELLRVLGWTVLNGLCGNDPSAIRIEHLQRPVLARRAERLLEELHRFFQASADALPAGATPSWRRAFVALNTGHLPGDRALVSAEYLMENSWGQLFFQAVDLTPLENDALRCYEVARRLSSCITNPARSRFAYRILDSRIGQADDTIGMIEGFLSALCRKPGEPSE